MSISRCELPSCGRTFRHPPSAIGRFCSRPCWYEHKSLSETSRQRSKRSAKMRWKYGMGLDEYDEILSSQGGVCAICHGLNPHGKRLGVDHDHACCAGVRSCGKCIRALLCDRCNSLLGYANDSTLLLEKCIEYLGANSWQ